MNYYRRYMGDYMRDTAHLSLTEHGAYNLLLDIYYSTGGVLTADKMGLYRICSAFTAIERKAVDSVVRQFFAVEDDMLRNKRADAEIAMLNAVLEKQRANGSKGGRPPKNNPEVNPKETQTITQKEPKTNPEKTHGLFLANPPPNPNETPPTTNHQIKTSSVGRYGFNQLAREAGDLTDRPTEIHDSTPENSEETTPSGNGQAPPCPIERIAELYRAKLPDCRPLGKPNREAVTALNAFWRGQFAAHHWASEDDALRWFGRWFDWAGESDFLTGKAKPKPGEKPFVASFKYLIDPENFDAIANGEYHDA